MRLVPITAIIVDDSLAEREWIKLALRNADIAWLEASNPVRAASLARAVPVDVIVLDLHIPPMEGREAVDTLRACGYAGPVVVYTGYTDVEVIRSLLGEGILVATKGITDPTGLAALVFIAVEASNLG